MNFWDHFFTLFG